jgi:hypothetical protein
MIVSSMITISRLTESATRIHQRRSWMRARSVLDIVDRSFLFGTALR